MTQQIAEQQIAEQPEVVPITIGAGRSDPTPVFGTAEPPGGVAGALRRVAYRIPEHRPSHWMALLLADRVDVLAHRIRGTVRGEPEDRRQLTRMSARVVVPLLALMVVRRIRS